MQRYRPIVIQAPDPGLGGLPLGLLAVLLTAAFLMGGSARGDAASLLLLRPLTAVIAVAAAVIALPRAWQRAPAATGVGIAALLLCLLHLVPMPPAIWTQLPGRGIAADVYRAAGMPLPWRPLTLSPADSWNAAFFLLAPLSALILVLSLSSTQVRRALLLLAGLAVLHAAVGTLQSLGVSWLHLYAITNAEFVVGLFANRNHAALLFACTLPLFGLLGPGKGGGRTPAGMKPAILAMAVIVLLPLILLTGSRAGLAWAALALPLTLWVHGRRFGSSRFAAAWPKIAFMAVIGLAAVFILQERAPAFLRLADTGGPSELRVTAAPAIWRAVGDHWPWGSGMGSFAKVYAIYEPRNLLGPAYLNHAHNDGLELLLTGGLPAALLAVCGVACLVRAIARKPKPDAESHGDDPRWARAGLSIIVLLTLGSIVDYPLRTPILAVLLAISAALVARRGSDAYPATTP